MLLVVSSLRMTQVSAPQLVLVLELQTPLVLLTLIIQQILNVGVVTANFFYGNGAGLTGIAGTENIITGTMTTGNLYECRW